MERGLYIGQVGCIYCTGFVLFLSRAAAKEKRVVTVYCVLCVVYGGRCVCPQ
jgi:hypothetical protein